MTFNQDHIFFFSPFRAETSINSIRLFWLEKEILNVSTGFLQLILTYCEFFLLFSAYNYNHILNIYLNQCTLALIVKVTNLSKILA